MNKKTNKKSYYEKPSMMAVEMDVATMIAASVTLYSDDDEDTPQNLPDVNYDNTSSWTWGK